MENAVQRCQISDQEIWLLGLVSHEILTQLQNIMYNKQKIVFPSLIIGWKSKQKALTDLQSKVIDNNQQYNVVIFHIKGISALKSNFDWIFAYNANGFIKRMVSFDQTYVFDIISDSKGAAQNDKKNVETIEIEDDLISHKSYKSEKYRKRAKR